MSKKRFELSEKFKLFPHEVIIWHPNSWGGAFSDHHWWMAEKADDPSYVDYHSKIMLICLAKRENLPYVVLRVHHDGTCSVMELSVNETRGE